MTCLCVFSLCHCFCFRKIFLFFSGGALDAERP